MELSLEELFEFVSIKKFIANSFTITITIIELN